MWNVLRILLHRPLLSDSDMKLTYPTTSKSSFAACSEAAINIVRIVRLYDKAFSVKRAPYVISYATYVAATIHVRVAATCKPPSEAHECLLTCLLVFSQNSETNYAVRKASLVVESLCRRMGVSLEDLGSHSAQQQIVGSGPGSLPLRHGRTVTNAADTSICTDEQIVDRSADGERFVHDLDIDAIMHNFMQNHQT